MNRTPLVTRLLLGASALVSLAVVTAACSASPSSSSSGAVSQGGVTKPLSGSDVYLMSCARCHGADRLGKRDAPKLDSVRMASLGDEPLRMLILYGKGRMPAFGALTDERVDVLVEYLRNG